jgi:hypothetical protein
LKCEEILWQADEQVRSLIFWHSSGILLDKAAEMWLLKHNGDGVHPATAHRLITPNRIVLLGVFYGKSEKYLPPFVSPPSIELFS